MSEQRGETTGQRGEASEQRGEGHGVEVPGSEDAQAAGSAQAPGLDETDKAVLAFAARGWPSPGVRERAIRERLDMSPTRYFQLLNALLDDVDALAYDPVTVNRLRRERQERRARTR